VTADSPQPLPEKKKRGAPYTAIAVLSLCDMAPHSARRQSEVRGRCCPRPTRGPQQLTARLRRSQLAVSPDLPLRGALSVKKVSYVYEASLRIYRDLQALCLRQSGFKCSKEARRFASSHDAMVESQ
jgi:hypothetical protein